MKVTIPLPPSKNAAYTERAVAKKNDLVRSVHQLSSGGSWKDVLRSLTVVRHRSEAYLTYLEELQRWLDSQKTTVLEGDIEVQVVAFFPDRRVDLPNIADVLFDALEGRCYANDSQVVRFSFLREVDKENPRCVVSIEGVNRDLFEGAADDDFKFDLDF